MADTISGYAVRFNDETVIGGQFREKIAPGAFSRTLEQDDVIAILSHDVGRVLGRVSAGTLDLREDRIGLYATLTVDPSTPSGAEALGTVGRGDVKGWSFGFFIRDEVWQDGGDRLPLRIVREVELIEVTLTALPAYPTTSASLRSDSDSAQRHALAAARRRAEAAMRLRGIR